MGLLKLATEQSQWRKQPIQFIFPSSIAIYGMPGMERSNQFDVLEAYTAGNRRVRRPIGPSCVDQRRQFWAGPVASPILRDGPADVSPPTTDAGVIGWSEYNESFGGAGLTAVIEALASQDCHT